MTINKGFTLIEILMVIVIIGITVGFALIAFGDFGESRRIQFSAEQLANTIRLAEQQAILDNSTLGLRIDNSSYQLLKFKSTNWEPLSAKGIFKIHYFPKNLVIHLKTNTKPISGSPAIVINASGDLTPFTLGFGVSKNKVVTVLTGKQDGSLEFTGSSE